MAIFENILNAMRANDDDYDEYIENEEEEAKAVFEEDEDYEAPPSRAARRREPEFEPPRQKRRAPVQDYSAAEKGRTKLEMVTPKTFEEAAGIADSLKLRRRAVLMSLEAADSDTSRRLLDFLSGAVYGLGGKIRRFSGSTYIITPDNVDLVGDTFEAVENAGYDF